MNNELTLAICMYNAERYIEETLQSVVNQTFQHFHLLIVNDCSSDNSLQIVQTFFQENPRQNEIISFEDNRGIAYARHFAERHARTKYMMFLDADDVLYPEAVEKLYHKITSDADLMAVGCYLEYIDQNGKKIGGGLFLGETTKSGFYQKANDKKLIFMQPTAVYERGIALSVGGYQIDGFPDGKPRYQDYCEDLDLWTRMSDLYAQGKAIVVVPEILCKYRKGDGLSSSSFNMVLKMKYVKRNLLRRRAGEQEHAFSEFYRSLSLDELNRIERDAAAADALHQAVFHFKKGHLFQGGLELAKSIWKRPDYIFDKIKNNYRMKRKF